jgi:drug/metabolite transporter (DMT)-like permease
MAMMFRIFLESGFMAMILSAFFFAITDIIIKFISPSLGVIQIAFVRFLIGALILWPMLKLSGQSLMGNSIRVLLLRGFTGTLAFFCLLKAIAMIPLSNAMVLFYTFPLFATLFAFFLLKERFKRLEIMLTLVGMIGIYIFINPSSHTYTIGHMFGLLAGCFAGFTIVLIRKLRKTNGPLIIYFYFCIVGGIISFPFFIIKFKLPDLEQSSLLVLLAVIFLVAQVFMNQGFKFCKASEGSVILMSEVVYAGIAGVILFDDTLSLNFLAGACLIIGSGVGLNLIAHKNNISVPMAM